MKAAIPSAASPCSNDETTTVCTPAGALFAAGDVLSWLAAGAQSVDWWDMNNYGNTGASCTSPDYGMFTSASPPVPETPYYGYVLASVLARPGALLAAMGTSDPVDVLAFRSRLPGGQEAVALLNTSTSSARTVTFRSGLPRWRGRPERPNARRRSCCGPGPGSFPARGASGSGAITGLLGLPVENGQLNRAKASATGHTIAGNA